MDVNPVFFAAFWAGLASSASLYTSDISYRPLINDFTFPTSFVLVGMFLNEAMATTEHDGSAATDPPQDPNTPSNLPNPGGSKPNPQSVPFLLPIGAQAIQQQLWQGPYPPPEAVERYDKVHPGAFARILTMAENMQAAQIEQSKIALLNAHSDTRRGHWLGSSIGALALIGAVVIGLWGNVWLAAAFLAVPVMGLAKALVESTRQRGSENKISNAAAKLQVSRED